MSGIVIPPNNSGANVGHNGIVIPPKSNSFNGTSLKSKPTNFESRLPPEEAFQQPNNYHQTSNFHSNNNYQSQPNLNNQTQYNQPTNQNESYNHQQPPSNVPNTPTGVNVNVSGQSTHIHLQQNPLSQFNHNSNPMQNEGLFPFSVQDILNTDDIHKLSGIIEHLEYTLKLAESKKLILEAQNALRAGTLR